MGGDKNNGDSIRKRAKDVQQTDWATSVSSRQYTSNIIYQICSPLYPEDIRGPVTDWTAEGETDQKDKWSGTVLRFSKTGHHLPGLYLRVLYRHLRRNYLWFI